MKESKITVIDNINGEIRRHGLSKEDFCHMLGIDRRTFTSWQAKGDMPCTKLLKSANILGCSVEYLVRDVKVPNSTNDHA